MAEEIKLENMEEIAGGKQLYNYVSNGWTPYTIKSGDTLGKYALEYGITVQQIMAVNPRITNANRIYAGDTILLPLNKGRIVY